jgi:hypothetical protein
LAHLSLAESSPVFISCGGCVTHPAAVTDYSCNGHGPWRRVTIRSCGVSNVKRPKSILSFISTFNLPSSVQSGHLKSCVRLDDGSGVTSKTWGRKYEKYVAGLACCRPVPVTHISRTPYISILMPTKTKSYTKSPTHILITRKKNYKESRRMMKPRLA